jgi:hypothetical protein
MSVGSGRADFRGHFLPFDHVFAAGRELVAAHYLAIDRIYHLFRLWAPSQRFGKASDGLAQIGT